MKRLITPLTLLAGAAFVVAPADANTPLVFIKGDGGTEEVVQLYWQQVLDGQPIPFAINQAGTPDIDIPPGDPDVDEFEAMTMGFEVWETVPGVPIDFDLQMTTTNSAGFDGENVIFFADLGDVGYGGVTLLTFDNTTGQILDVDIHMNDHSIRWVTSPNGGDGEPLACPCPGTDPDAVTWNDIQGLTAHEVGHALGLDHSTVGTRETGNTPTMYPRGIWGVPGDPDIPPNSRYRTIELDDIAGIQSLYPPAGPAGPGSAQVQGVVHDSRDEPLFGGHVIARNLQTGEEVGAMSGVLAGPYQPDAYRIGMLPDGEYELRVEPLIGVAPGFVGVWNFGGIPQAVIPAKFPGSVDLDPTYHFFADDAADATPVTLSSGGSATVDFRPMAVVSRVDKFLRVPRPLPIEVRALPDVTGPLQSATFLHSIDGETQAPIALPTDGTPYTVDIPLLPAGTLVEFQVQVQTTGGVAAGSQTIGSRPSAVQIGLSGEPIVLVDMMGAFRIAAVESKTMFEVDWTPADLAFPLGVALHREKLGIYSAGFGYDNVGFFPMTDGLLPTVQPRPFDQDGDGLLDELEPAFGTGVRDPDTDGDLALDGDEISEREFIHPDAGGPSFEALGGAVADDGVTPLGSPLVSIAIYDLTLDQWASASMSLTPSGRFRLRLPAGSSYVVSFYNTQTSGFILNSADFTGNAGEVASVGVTTLPLPALDPPAGDTGTDPLDGFDGSLGLFRTDSTIIELDPGADPHDLELTPDQDWLFVTGHEIDKVYKIDTQTDQVVAEVVVPEYPKGLSITPDGQKVYVACTSARVVVVLDVDTLAILETIPIPDGNLHYVRVSADGSTAVVTSEGAANFHLIDTATDQLTASLPLPFGGLYFLSHAQPSTDIMIGGQFQIGTSEVALLDTAAEQVEIVDLGAQVNTTSGVAVHPDGQRGYVVHWLDPQLFEISLDTGAILRTLDFDFIDIRDLRVVEGITHPDCNANGILDELDIAAGTSTDDNGDGIPDECPPPCPTDVDGDGNTNVVDLLEVILAWGTGDPDADVDDSGTVDVTDLLQVILNWGPCP